jgi:putative ABC transport system ATP-binding protein
MLQMKNIRVRNVLTDLDFTINKNEFVLLIGENGAGKTTLFNTISGVIRPDSGNIYIDNEDVTSMPQHRRATLVANVFHDPKVGTIGSMTIRENLQLASLRGKSITFIRNNCSRQNDLYRDKLQMLHMNLENRLDDYAGDLSGGQRQALSIIMSMISDSKLLLLDEITSALDPKSSARILAVIDAMIRQEKKTCLMITHDLKHMDEYGDKVFVLQNGKLYRVPDQSDCGGKRQGNFGNFTIGEGDRSSNSSDFNGLTAGTKAPR